jgi:hypothetical protein
MDPGTKRRNAPAHERSGRVQKARRKTPPPHVNERAESVMPSLHGTPATQRMASNASLIEQWTIIYTADMEAQITAEARGVTGRISRRTYSVRYIFMLQRKSPTEARRRIRDENWRR